MCMTVCLLRAEPQERTVNTVIEKHDILKARGRTIPEMIGEALWERQNLKKSLKGGKKVTHLTDVCDSAVTDL